MTMAVKHMNYKTMGKISEIISSTQDMADICQHIVSQLTQALKLKGAAILVLNRKTRELELAATAGLSQRYLDKGPISATKSIAGSLDGGPVAIYNVQDDPRLQYPAEAVVEGIASILSLPLVLRGRPLGALRVYTSEPWEFTMEDITFMQAIADLISLALENLRITHAYKTSIAVLKTLRNDREYARPVM